MKANPGFNLGLLSVRSGPIGTVYHYLYYTKEAYGTEIHVNFHLPVTL